MSKERIPPCSWCSEVKRLWVRIDQLKKRIKTLENENEELNSDIRHLEELRFWER